MCRKDKRVARILLAGASVAIGKRLNPLLRGAGHHVTGTIRSEAKAEILRALGADPLVVDVFDAETLTRAVATVRPQIVIHQLTDLPRGAGGVGLASRFSAFKLIYRDAGIQHRNAIVRKCYANVRNSHCVPAR